MLRIGLHIIVAMIMFITGVAVNQAVDGLGSVAIDHLDDVESLPELASAVFLNKTPSLYLSRANSCHLVVKVSDDGRLYLNGQEMGSLEQTDLLSARLMSVFRVREELRVYRAGVDLTSDITEDERIEKTVFIRAPRSRSYGDIVDLIEVIRQTGASPIGLVTDAVEWSK